MHTKLFIGIDSGATKTEVAAIDIYRRKLLLGYGGPSNPASIGIDHACRNIISSIYRALKNYTYSSATAEIDLVAISLAGYLNGYWNKDLERCIRLNIDLEIGKIVIFEDIKAAHTSSFLLGNGIVGVLGTGSNFYGRINDLEASVGGWGHLIDDVGGAYSIGMQGLRYVFRYIDGREHRKTSLIECSLKHYSVDSFSTLIRKIYSVDDPKGYIASFSKCVFKCASEGDDVALNIIDSESREIAHAIATVRKRLVAQANIYRPPNLQVSLTGSTYQANKHVFKPFIENALRNLGLETDIKDPIIRQSCSSIVTAIGRLKSTIDSSVAEEVLNLIIESCRTIST
jgi:N-acetylglucosamine kinase